MTRLVLAVICGLLIAVGVGLVFIPAGLVVAGVEGLSGLYVVAYLEARRGG